MKDVILLGFKPQLPGHLSIIMPCLFLQLSILFVIFLKFYCIFWISYLVDIHWKLSKFPFYFFSPSVIFKASNLQSVFCFENPHNSGAKPTSFALLGGLMFSWEWVKEKEL